MAENQNPAEPVAENTPTQTLFRFVSLRSPELSDEKDQSKRFVLMSDQVKTDSHFYYPVKDGSGTKRQLLLAQASTFTDFISKDKPTNNLDTFKERYKIIYDFSVWLAKNKGTCTYQEFLNKRDAVYAEHNAEYPDPVTLWDNFIFQVVTQKDFYIKEVMMQAILALHALQTITIGEEETMLLINARIVLPKEMMMDESASSSSIVSRVASTEPKQAPPSEEMKKQQEISLAKTKLSRIESLKKNLSTVEKQYNKEYQAEYKVQDETHQARIAPDLEAYNEAVAAAQEEYCGVRPPGTVYDPKDPCQQPRTVPYPKLPKFEFDFRDEVVAENLVESLKPESVETLFDVLGYKFNTQNEIGRAAGDDAADLENLLDGRNTFLELTSVINENVERLNTVIVENTQGNEETYTSIGGVIIPTARTVAVPFTYELCPRLVYKFYKLDLALNVPDATWDVSGISYALIYGNNNTVNGYDFVKSRIGNTIHLNDILDPAVESSTLQDATFDIKVYFTNGRMAQFSTPRLSTRTCSTGKFELEVEEGEPPVVIVEDEDNFIPSGFGFKNIGVADYLKVEQSTHAYVEGEVAHIENVMAREYREKSTRRLRRSENTTTSSTDTEREQLTDTTTANRFEMQSEISKMMQEATDVGISANAHIGFTDKYTLDLGANYANHKSKEESTRQAITQSQDITARAMDRIVTKVHEERIEKIIDEFEETNSHGLDNRKGDKHVVGVYRWVDKLMKNQIYNYGKRMMFEFMIPEPAKLHLLGMTNVKSTDQTNLVLPDDPRTSTTMQMKDFSVLGTPAGDAIFKYWAGKYNVELDEKLDQTIFVSHSFSDRNQGFDDNGTGRWTGVYNNNDFKIPENYEATFVKGTLNVGHGTYNKGNINPASHVYICGKESGSDVSMALSSIREKITLSSVTWDIKGISGSLVATCQLTQEAKITWQQKTFKVIIDAYEEALIDYNNKLAEEQSKAVVIKDSNPNFYRQIENTVLRKNCISYMSNRAAGSTHGYGLSGLTQGSSFMDYETVLSSDLDKYTAFVKFMEQAFEWENLSYYLYPYYWGNKQNWENLYQSENTDPLFRNFMQSGMARVIVTVRPGFEDVVQFYLATGKIWNGGEVPVIGDELYLSIVDEMKQPKGIKQGKAWLTRLPTTLNILQAESIGLKVAHALPFTTENPDDFEIPSEVITEEKFNFEPNGNLLGGETGEEEKIISGDWV